jgi:hypothetical protein
MREIQDEQGADWEVFGLESVVAHGRRGAVLAFRPANAAGAEPLATPVTFNSSTAAELAIRTMGDKELVRRLTQARIAAGEATRVRRLRR